MILSVLDKLPSIAIPPIPGYRIDVSRWRMTPFAHQIEGVRFLLKNRYAMLGDDVGLGKGKQTVDTAFILREQREISRVIVITPATVRGVWFDQDLGTLAEHGWLDVPFQISEFHQKIRLWKSDPSAPKESLFRWIVTNYDYLRDPARLKFLMQFCGPGTMLVLDESWKVKNWTAKQTKACWHLRNHCGRIVLLNGTPIADSPFDMFSQGQLMSPSILRCPSKFQFRSRYAIVRAEHGFPKIVGWQNLEDLQQRFAPYVLRREKQNCSDLPPELPSTHLIVPLSEATWKLYKKMRDDLVVWLENASVSMASQAAVKTLRLAQITSGFLGGVEDSGIDVTDLTNLPEWFEGAKDVTGAGPKLREIGREKFEFFMQWFDDRLEEDPHFKLLTWSYFRPEIDRMLREMREMPKYRHVEFNAIVGGQKISEREAAIRLLTPKTMPEGPAVVFGQVQVSSGITLVGAHVYARLSRDWSMLNHKQSAGRVHRYGQTKPVTPFDLVAVGPAGQKTIDIKQIQALQKKIDVATFTTSAWVQWVKEE
jgi:hypothetical protein